MPSDILSKLTILSWAGLTLSVAAFFGQAIAADIAVSSVISGDAFAESAGAIGVNAAAGDLNQQFIGAAVGQSGSGTGETNVSAAQEQGEIGQGPEVAIALITGGAFRDVAGLIRVNQAGGLGNLQANGAAISLGLQGELAADVDLQQSHAGQQLPPDADTTNGAAIATVSSTAFLNAQGVVQVNQAGGSGNSSTNAFALRFQAGAIQ